MAVGDIELDGRPYITVDPKMINRSNANQVAAKVGASGDYDDLLNWSIWVMDSWQSGMGQRDPEGGGWLYGSVNGMYKGQLLPSSHPTFNHSNLASNISGGLTTVLVGDDPTALYEKLGGRPVASSLVLSNYGNITGVYILLPGKRVAGCTATAVEVELLHGANNTLDDNIPLSMWSSGLINLIDDDRYHWQFIACSDWTPSGNYQPCVVITTSAGVVPILGRTAGGRGQLMATGSWQDSPGLIFNMTSNPSSTNHATITGLRYPFVMDGMFWAVSYTNPPGQTELYTLNLPNKIGWVGPHSGAMPSGLGGQGVSLVLNDTAYVPSGNDWVSITYPPLVISSPTTRYVEGFYHWNGIVYAWYEANLYYTADLATWEGPFETGGDGNNRIRAVAGLDRDIIVFLDSGVLKFAPGDIFISLASFVPSGITYPNGVTAISFQGNVYFALGESIIRYDGAGFLPMGPNLGEGSGELGGRINTLFADDNWLYCCTDKGMILAHNGQGWHSIGDVSFTATYVPKAALAPGQTANTILSAGGVDANGSGFTGCLYSVPSSAGSPFRLGGYNYSYFSWFETDWFNGGIREVQKDFESIYIDADNLSAANGYINAYWMDEDSTDWEFLGTFNQSGGQEIRWSNPSTRPNSRRIKLKFHLFCLPTNRMRINAIRTKFQPMVTDRWRWQIPIRIAGTAQQFIDGDTQITYTEAQQIAHLDGLTKRVPPFIFKDTDGSQYEVKVVNASRGVDSFERLPGAATTRVDYVYNLVLEQVTSDAYAP